MEAFDGPLKAAEGLPAFQAESNRVESAGGPRMRELGDTAVCLRTGPGGRGPLVRRLRKKLLEGHRLDAGFTEMPLASQDDFMDVDSGPVLCGIGSVSSAFGIGAAKTVGRMTMPLR